MTDKPIEPIWKTRLFAAPRQLAAWLRYAETWANAHSASIGFVISLGLGIASTVGIVGGVLETIQHRTLGWGLAMTGIDLAAFGILFLLIPIQGWAARGGGRQ